MRLFSLDELSQSLGIRHVNHHGLMSHLMTRGARVAVYSDNFNTEALKRNNDFLTQFSSAQQHDNTAQISQHSEHIYRRGSANLQRIASSRQQSEQLRDLSEQLQHTVHRFQV